MIEIQVIATDWSFFSVRMQVGKANTSLVPWFGPVVKRVEGLFMARDRMTGATKIQTSHTSEASSSAM